MTLRELIHRAGPLWSAADANAGSGEGGGTAEATPANDGQGGARPPADGGADAAAGRDGGGPDYSWFAEDLTADERRTLEAKGFKSPRDLYKSMRAAESAVRGDHIPGPPDNPDQKGEWFKEHVAPRLGVPEKPDGYGIEKPQFDEAVAPYVRFDDDRHGRFLGRAHELGLSPEQASGILELYKDEMGTDVQSHIERAQADETEMQAELKREWGRDFDQNMRAAVEAAKEVGIDDAKAEALRSGGVIGSTALAKAMHELAQLRGDDTMRGGGQGGGRMSQEQAQRALDAFGAKNGEALNKHDHAQHGWAMDEFTRLKRLAGRGSEGRR